ncbi:MAG: serine/threonine-protein kinase [Polyangiaceae bacterium]
MSMAVDNQARAMARVGTVLKDKWRLDALLGIGGMAVVYSATHRNHKRVAIKMLLPELAGVPEARSRFVREGYAANTIEHPGALSVLDDDVAEEGLPFLVMELLEGETVEARWRRNGERLDLAEVLGITAAVLDVLVVAHAKGVVHRDIKPENLFLLRTGGLKVLDFGIARVLEGARSGTETRAGTVMGTPAFMAPEQALAKWDQVDGRTDLWAVAATMFTLLSGQHVHEGASGNEQFVKSATQQARSIASCTQGLPRSVVALVDRALKFDRAARWPDARAMQEAVKGAYEALTGTPLVIESPTSGPRSWNSMSGTQSASGTQPMSGAQQIQPTMLGGIGPRPPLSPSQTTMRSVAGPRATTSSAAMPAVKRRTSGSFESADPSVMSTASGAGRDLAPPPMTALSMDAFLAGRTAERDAANADVARYGAIVAEIQGRLAGVRRRVAQAQEQIAAARKERAAEEERFRRQMNARLEGVGEARKDFRRAMCEVAEIALEDTAHFPPDVGADDRVAIEKTAAVAAARRREDALHRAALTSFEPVALKRGVGLAAAGVVLLLLLFFSPMIVRSCASDTGTMVPSTSGETQSP